MSIQPSSMLDRSATLVTPDSSISQNATCLPALRASASGCSATERS
jgi:hypothetical protein